MDLKNFSVFQELFELSRKSDEIIDKTFADSIIDDKFFEDTKNKIYQILNSNCSYKKTPRSTKKENETLKSEAKYSLESLANKSTVHGKNRNTKSDDKTSSDRNPSCSVRKSKRFSSSGTIFISSSDINESSVQILETDDTNLEIQSRDNTEDRPQKLDMEECRKMDDKDNNIVPSDLNNSITTSCQESSCQKVESTGLTPDLAGQKNFVMGETYVVKKSKCANVTPNNDRISLGIEGNVRNKYITRSIRKYCGVMGIPLDGSFDSAKEISDKTKVISERSDFVSSDENNDCKISGNSNTDSEGKNSIFPFNVNEQLKTSANCNGGKRRRSSEVLIEINTPEKVKSIVDKATLIPSNIKDKSRNSANFIIFSSSDENSPGILEHNHESIFKQGTLTNECGNTNYANDDLKTSEMFTDVNDLTPYFRNNNKNVRSDFSEKKILKSDKIRNFSPFTPSEKCKYTFAKTSSESSAYDFSNDEKDSENRKNKCHDGKKELSAKRYRKVIFGDEIHVKQLQTNSVSAYSRKTTNRNTKSNTRMESIVNCNRQSLKDKAEEKRKLREIREQKTRERRELLEKVREERIREREQRLKQRFQQHEEMLKQKREKFKIKPQNRQQRNAKRSFQSTSSKDSKEDGTKDSDDFCRNAAGSGQKLSKEGNGYHDVSLKKIPLASLEDNVGLNPGISEEHNAIFVSRESTPVEFLVSCDITASEKAEMISVSQDAIRMKDFKESKGIKQPYLYHPQPPDETLLKNSSPKINNASVRSDASISTTSENKQDEKNKDLIKIKTKKLRTIKSIKSLSKQMFQKGFRNNEPSYCLRSSKKIYPNDTPVSPLMEIVHNMNEHNENSSELIPPSPENKESEFSYLCFKKFKTVKTKKNLKTPASTKTLVNSRRSSEIRKRKRCLENSTKENIMKKNSKTTSAKKSQALKSYKISDMHEDSFDESKVDPKKIPLWATGIYLKQALIQQQYKPPNTEKIFGVIPKKPINLAAFFKVDKPEYHRRTSSEKWNTSDNPA